jgi:hypothetical protein
LLSPNEDDSGAGCESGLMLPDHSEPGKASFRDSQGLRDMNATPVRDLDGSHVDVAIIGGSINGECGATFDGCR